MNNIEKREYARALYVKGSFNQKQIAEMVGVTPKTLKSWIEAGGWDDQRESLQITRPQLLQESYAQLKAINEKIKTEFGGVPNKELSDAKAVIRKEIDSLSVKPIHKYVEVFEEFIDFLSQKHPIHLTQFAELSQEFIQTLSSNRK